MCNDVIDASGGIAWEDIAGLQTAKDLIREIVVWPMLNPSIFTVGRGPTCSSFTGDAMARLGRRIACTCVPGSQLLLRRCICAASMATWLL